MNDKPIVVVTGGGQSLTEQISEVFGRDAVLVVDDLGAVESEMLQPLRAPDPVTFEIVMRREIADDLRRPIYLDRPVKDWQQNQKRGRMKPRRR